MTWEAGTKADQTARAKCTGDHCHTRRGAVVGPPSCGGRACRTPGPRHQYIIQDRLASHADIGQRSGGVIAWHRRHVIQLITIQCKPHPSGPPSPASSHLSTLAEPRRRGLLPQPREAGPPLRLHPLILCYPLLLLLLLLLLPLLRPTEILSALRFHLLYLQLLHVLADALPYAPIELFARRPKRREVVDRPPAELALPEELLDKRKGRIVVWLAAFD